MEHFELEGEFITIAQLLKALGYVGSGGETKYFLYEHAVLLNDAEVYEKKKKIKKGDIVSIDNKKIIIE